MFDVRSDERLNAIQNRAGFIAYWCYSGMTVIILLLVIIDGGALYDPWIVLGVPWLTSMMIFVVAHFGKGYFRTIREEANKSPKQTRETRLRLLRFTGFFGVLMFLFKRFDIFDDDAATLGTDLLETCFITATVGAIVWFMEGRKVRVRDE